jgi:O-antigen ligase
VDAVAHKQGILAVGVLGSIAAVSAMSLVTFGYQRSASGYALLCLAPLALGIFSLLVYARPLVTFVMTLVFITSPIRLALTAPQSAVISMFLLAAATVGLALRTPCRAIAPDPMHVPIGIFAAYGIVSAVHGFLAGNEASYLFGDCFQVVEFATVYFLVSQLLRSDASIRLVLRALLISILITVLVELVLFALGPSAGGLLPSWEGGSSSEELVRTIDIDATILFTVLINLYPAIRSRKTRYLIWAALIPTVANIALSLSRGLWICTLVAVVVSLALQGGKTRARLLKASACVSVCIVLLATMWKTSSDSEDSLMDVFEERVYHGVDQVEQGLGGAESMATRRFLEMEIVGPQVLDRPWFGYGLGATYLIGGFAVLDSGTKALIDHHFIHNLYLVTAFRMGLVGLALLLWVLLRYFRRILDAYKKMSPGFSKALIAGLVASVVGQLFLSMTEPTVIDHPTCVLIATAMAISLRLAPPAANREKQIL